MNEKSWHTIKAVLGASSFHPAVLMQQGILVLDSVDIIHKRGAMRSVSTALKFPITIKGVVEVLPTLRPGS